MSMKLVMKDNSGLLTLKQRNAIEVKTIFRFIQQIENMTGRCFQDDYPELDEKIGDALSRDELGQSIRASTVIFRLAKLVDSLAEGVKDGLD